MDGETDGGFEDAERERPLTYHCPFTVFLSPPQIDAGGIMFSSCHASVRPSMRPHSYLLNEWKYFNETGHNINR